MKLSASDDLRALRALARQRRSAATAKVRRLRQKGVNIEGTAMDPRRAPTAVNRYSKPQLNAYIRELNAFTRRDTSYIAGAGGQPLSQQKWLQYKSLEARINDIANQHLESIRDIKLPNQDMTIGQRRATILPDKLAAMGDRAERPFPQRNRLSQHIEGSDALDKLIKDAQRRLRPNYLHSQVQESRKQLNQMLKELGNTDFQKQVDSLNDHQFNILWNDTNFANDVSQSYVIAKARATTSSDRWYSSVIQDSANDIRDILAAAAEYPTSPTPKQSRKTRRRKK